MSNYRPQCAGCLLLALAIWLVATSAVRAQDAFSSTPIPSQEARPEVQLGHSLAAEQTVRLAGQDQAALVLKSDFTSGFDDGSESVLMLKGNCQITLGQKQWTAPLMVLWEQPTEGSSRKRILAYLEANSEYSAVASSPTHREQKPYLLVELETSGPYEWHGRSPVKIKGAIDDPVYQRARQRRGEVGSSVQLTQYSFEPSASAAPISVDLAQIPSTPPEIGGSFFPAPGPQRIPQHVTISPRFLGGRLEAKGEISEGSIPPEYVVTLTGGVNIVVDNVPLNIGGQMVLSRIDLTADRAVIWTDANHIGELGGFDIDSQTPFQVYLEGNIVVRQGNNDIRASHAFYDVNQRRGLAMNAELRTMLPDLQGTLRLRAAEVRQLSDNKYQAKDAFFTTSEFGKPKYRIQASDVFLEEQFLGPPGQINPVTGEPAGGVFVATSLNNTIFVEDVPIFVAPYLASPAQDPRIPVRKFNVGYSGMFGATLETAWDLETILGLRLDPGIDLQAQADFFSRRGPGGGVRSKFEFDSFLFGNPVRNEGWGQAYYLNDHGEDNLGLGRRDLPLADDNRGRVIFRNRTNFSDFTWLQSEIGYVSDRNFMEQYFEPEWDNQKDLENSLVLNHQIDNITATLMGSIRSNDFTDSTNWLPRGDLTVLGQPILNSPVIWNSHSMVGYGQLKPAEAPFDPTLDPFQPLPYFANVEGEVAMTRHELNMPFDLGPVHVVPYVMGELAHWGEDLTGSTMDRAWGTAGIKASVQFSKYMPEVRNSILGLNGLAHKVVFDAEYYYGDSSESLDQVAQYNAFDEDAQERFRERLSPVELGGAPVPAYMDPRYYAVRSGAGRSITGATHELVDDQHTLWLGMRHRWQTKVGPAENSRVVDWMEFDLGTAIFPNADQDNFGETLGLINSRYAWHVSQRTSFIANGVWDVFDDGQRVWNAGILHQRSARGSLYLGYRQVHVGSIESRLITGSLSYVLSPNLYVMTAAAQFDVAEGIDRGESVTITRIGEFFLLHFGIGYDRSRDNVGVALSLEPKFGSYGSSSMQLNSLLGIR